MAEWIFFIHTDCVPPTKFRRERVNLLEAMTMVKMGGLDFQFTINKPLNKSLLDEIAITIDTQQGSLYKFGETSYSPGCEGIAVISNRPSCRMFSFPVSVQVQFSFSGKIH